MSDVKIELLGHVDLELAYWLTRKLREIYGIEVKLSDQIRTPPEEAYNPRRHQYLSNVILEYARRTCKGEFRILFVTELDLYVPGLNFVFGQAESPGKYAIVSLHRLHPEFYGDKPCYRIFSERALKEAVHELGHTYGLTHCVDSRCVMYFSNTIIDTDRKSFKFCSRCYAKLKKKILQQ